MSDDINKVPQAEVPAADTLKKEPAPEKANSFLDGKYKSQQEFEKAYKEAEKKLGEQGDELKQSREFSTYVKPILDVIQTDEEVFKILDKKLRSEPSKPQPDKVDQSEQRGVVSDLLLARFETEHGIDKMDSEDSAKVRRDIGVKIAELTGQQLADIDLRRLPKLLENTYALVKPKSSVETENEDGTMPSVPSSPGKTEKSLSKEEAKVAQGLGITREEYLEGKKGLSKEYISK